MTNAEHTRARRERRRAQGLCTECHEKATSGPLCEVHRAYKKAKKAAYQAAQRAWGLCIDCPRPSVAGGRCRHCADRQNERWRGERAIRREMGICQRCNRRPFKGGYCKTHYAVALDAVRRSQARKRAR